MADRAFLTAEAVSAAIRQALRADERIGRLWAVLGAVAEVLGEVGLADAVAAGRAGELPAVGKAGYPWDLGIHARGRHRGVQRSQARAAQAASRRVGEAWARAGRRQAAVRREPAAAVRVGIDRTGVAAFRQLDARPPLLLAGRVPWAGARGIGALPARALTATPGHQLCGGARMSKLCALDAGRSAVAWAGASCALGLVAHPIAALAPADAALRVEPAARLAEAGFAAARVVQAVLVAGTADAVGASALAVRASRHGADALARSHVEVADAVRAADVGGLAAIPGFAGNRACLVAG